jgi:CheY-like chemotaxis protein
MKLMSDLRRVMLVEDDPDIAILAGIALREIAGLEFVHFSSGPEALKGVIEAAPDLIILDYRMPEMNGGEVLEALRSNDETRHFPVVFMTASLMPKHVGKLMELGALGVLPKPFDPVTLGDEVQKIWSQFSASA